MILCRFHAALSPPVEQPRLLLLLAREAAHSSRSGHKALQRDILTAIDTLARAIVPQKMQQPLKIVDALNTAPGAATGNMRRLHMAGGVCFIRKMLGLKACAQQGHAPQFVDQFGLYPFEHGSIVHGCLPGFTGG
ncbi:hypothetical protein [Desulfovibrio falkowii]|uniref:hypothetical protein n=1 Tax=Desulfovibrio sp. WGS1351 TaxID=3366814 RepID=UPI00372D7E47